MIAPQGATEPPEGSQYALIGDPSAHPGAFIDFRISVQGKGSAEEAKKLAAAALARRTSVLSKRTSSLLPIQEASAAQEDPSATMSLNLRISELETTV